MLENCFWGCHCTKEHGSCSFHRLVGLEATASDRSVHGMWGGYLRLRSTAGGSRVKPPSAVRWWWRPLVSIIGRALSGSILSCGAGLRPAAALSGPPANNAAPAAGRPAITSRSDLVQLGSLAARWRLAGGSRD